MTGARSLAEDPRECRHDPVKVVRVLPGECPGVRAGVEVPALGRGSLLAFGSEREDAGYLLS